MTYNEMELSQILAVVEMKIKKLLNCEKFSKCLFPDER